MIVSIGTDIIEVYRIRETIKRTPRFVDRVFTSAEISYCESKGAGAAQSFAGRFAAKEAFLKALRTGWRGKITWHDIEITNDEFGAPEIDVTGEAELLLKKMGVENIHVSIAHTTEHATAQIIFEK
ncbi:MAG: holo-ACP synthase [Pyrinomonadaceae bacterium]